MRGRESIAIVALIACARVAFAQESEEPGQPRIPTSTVGEDDFPPPGDFPPVRTMEEIPSYDEGEPLDIILEDDLPPCGPSAEAIYTEGFELLARNDRVEALKRFNAVLAACPEHPYAAELRRLAAFTLEPPKLGVLQRKRGPELMTYTEPATATVKSAAPPVAGTDALVRAEMVTVLTATGLVSGLFTCGALDCEDGRGFAAAAIGGAALAGGLSYAFSKRIDAGRAAAVEAGAWWGMWNGIAVPAALGARNTDAYTSALAMTLLGTATGAGVAVAVRPEAGSVSLATSAGLWAGVLALWAMSAGGTELFETQFFGAEVAASNAGLVIGAIASRFIHVSRGHVLLIDAGGVAGMLFGIGAAFLVNSDPDQELVGALGLVGTTAGLVTLGYLTRDFDRRDEDILVSIRPAPRGLAMHMTF